MCALLYAPTVVMTGFVTAGNYLWLYSLVRILQLISGFGAAVVPVLVMLLFKRLNPDDPNKQYG